MTLFRTYKLEDLLNAIFSGGTPSTTHPEYWNGEFPWLSSGETNQPYISKTEKTITQEGINQSSTRFAPPGAVVMASAGQGKTRGQTSFLKIGVYINQSIIAMVPDETQLLAKYLYYNLQFRYDELRSSSDSSSTRGSITTELLKTLKITIPDLPTQEKIASILSVYDDAIENNNKRIKILEKMAENLYREWFVRMRFPGHETAEYENGLPKGWRVYKFSEKVDIMSGGTPKTDNPKYYGGNIPFFTPKDTDGDFFTFTTDLKISEEGLENCNSRLYPVNTIIITARGTVGKTTLLAVPMAMNQSCYALRFKTLNAPYFLFFALNAEIVKLQSMANGGVFDTIIIKTFDSISLTLPSQDVVTHFENNVTSIMMQIKSLMAQNGILKKACNLLLPRLMSGKMEVTSR